MTAQSLIAGIRKKLETSKGGFRTPETTRWIAVVIGGLRQELPRAQSDIKILETRLSIFFSPRRHKKLQGGLFQAHCNILSTLDRLEWIMELPELPDDPKEVKSG